MAKPPFPLLTFFRKNKKHHSTQNPNPIPKSIAIDDHNQIHDPPSSLSTLSPPNPISKSRIDPKSKSITTYNHNSQLSLSTLFNKNPNPRYKIPFTIDHHNQIHKPPIHLSQLFSKNPNPRHRNPKSITIDDHNQIYDSESKIEAKSKSITTYKHHQTIASQLSLSTLFNKDLNPSYKMPCTIDDHNQIHKPPTPLSKLLSRNPNPRHQNPKPTIDKYVQNQRHSSALKSNPKSITIDDHNQIHGPPSFLSTLFPLNPKSKSTIEVKSKSITIYKHHQNHDPQISPSTPSLEDCNFRYKIPCTMVDKHNQNQKPVTEIVEEVCRIFRSQPRWEQTLLSDFPREVIFHPNFFGEVVKHQNNALLSLRFFKFLKSRRNILPDSSVCNLLFNSLVDGKATGAAKSFLDSTKYRPEPASFEAYIRSLCDNGSIKEAIGAFSQLKGSGVCPSLETWNSALSGSLNIERTDIVWKLYGEMLELGVVADVNTVGCIIRAFCVDNKVSEAYRLLRQVLADGVVPNNDVFNKLISRLCEQNLHEVSNVLHMMIANNRNPDVFTYQEIIHVLCERGEQILALRIFNDLKNRGHKPHNIMYMTMIAGLYKKKCIGGARKLWFEMIKKGILPNKDPQSFSWMFFRKGSKRGAKILHEDV